jgi:uracil phosphoribosyltransferase
MNRMKNSYFCLTDENSVAAHFLAQLREKGVHDDRLRFRYNLQRTGQILAYEISKTLPYETKVIETPLGTKEVAFIAEKPVLITILRGGLTFFQGFLDYFDDSECAFIGAYRAEHQDSDVKIKTDYIAAPSLEGKNVILIDPMLATGHSLADAVEHLSKRHGTPKSLHIACTIASKAGIDFLRKKFPHAKLWLGAVDDELNSASYIVPGLGDAGDLCFGEKL